jgi:23S rRNA pseudouridine2605 synthase
MARAGTRRGRGSAEDAPDDYRDAARGERLQRVMADAGIASRRDCERMIEEGLVTVNGTLVADLPAWVDPERDRIVVDGRVLPPPARPIYVLLNKPARVLTSARDEPGSDRRTVLDLVRHPSSGQLFPVGRLDFETTGLLLLTNDGELANRLTHPRYGVPKVYRAAVKGRVDLDSIGELEAGVKLTDRKDGRTVGASRTGPVEVAIVHREADRTVLEVTIREGRNRQVRRMLAALGYPVKKLERIAMGPLRLKGVARGDWRELTRGEVQALRRAAAQAAKAERGGARERDGKDRA